MLNKDINTQRILNKLSRQNKSSVSWIRYWRQRLNITSKELGERCGYDQPRISRLENAEVNGDLKLSTLKRIAVGLNMRLVYGFVPMDKKNV